MPPQTPPSLLTRYTLVCKSVEECQMVPMLTLSSVILDASGSRLPLYTLRALNKLGCSSRKGRILSSMPYAVTYPKKKELLHHVRWSTFACCMEIMIYHPRLWLGIAHCNFVIYRLLDRRPGSSLNPHRCLRLGDAAVNGY